MSIASFPRPEHVALLRQKIEETIRLRGDRMEVGDLGLNHLKCQYKFGLKRRPDDQWAELAIHFQYAERLARTRDPADLERLIGNFLDQHFEQDKV